MKKVVRDKTAEEIYLEDVNLVSEHILLIYEKRIYTIMTMSMDGDNFYQIVELRTKRISQSRWLTEDEMKITIQEDIKNDADVYVFGKYQEMYVTIAEVLKRDWDENNKKT